MSPGKVHKLIVVVVKKGLATKLVSAAKKAGAEGGTILFARGTAEKHVYENILGIDFEPEKEVILVVVPDTQQDAVLEAISIAGQLDKPGKGIGFVLDLSKVHGVARLLGVL